MKLLLIVFLFSGFASAEKSVCEDWLSKVQEYQYQAGYHQQRAEVFRKRARYYKFIPSLVGYRLAYSQKAEQHQRSVEQYRELAREAQEKAYSNPDCQSPQLK